MSNEQYSEVISLGVDCRVRYQISRHYYLLRNPHFDDDAFRRELFSNLQDSAPRGTFFFDWLVSPPHSVAAIIKRKFQGVFELDNLIINEKGSVEDRETKLIFHHEFSKESDRVTPRILQDEFPTVNKKILYLSEKTNKSIMNSRRPLFIAAGSNENNCALIIDAIKSTRRNDEFHVLGISVGESTLGFTSNGTNFSIYTMNRVINKPIARHWQGDDEEWHRLFSLLNVDWSGGAARLASG